MNIRSLLPLCASLLAGCTAVSPDSRIGAVSALAPGAWASSPAGQAGVDDAWIDRFGSAALSQLVDTAMERNHDLKIAHSRLLQAQSDIQIAASDALPQLDLNFNGSRSKRNFIGFPIGGNGAGGQSAASSSQADTEILRSISNSFGPSLDIRWELDVWGRIRAGTSAAVAAAEAAQQDYQAARVSLAAQLAKAWFALTEAAQQESLAREALTVFQDTEKALGDRFKTGQGGETSLGAQLRLARSDLASAQATLKEREELRRKLARQIEVIAGGYPSGKLVAAPELPRLSSTPPAGLPSELLQRRPDVLAAERRLAARGMALKEARRAVFPRLSLTGSVGTSTDELSNILNSDFGVWSLAGNVIQPILTGGQIRAQIEKRKTLEDEALASLQKTVLKAFQEVEDALDAESFLASREKALDEAAKLAAEADQEARADFRRGIGDILTVFQTQQRSLQAKAALLTIRRLRLDNRVNLHLALGGDFKVRK